MSSKNSKLPKVRHEGKSHNIKIQLKPTTHNTAKGKVAASKQRTVFPKMTIKSSKTRSPFEVVVEPPSTGVSLPLVQSPPLPAAFVTDGSSPVSSQEDEDVGQSTATVNVKAPESSDEDGSEGENSGEDEDDDEENGEDDEDEDNEDEGVSAPKGSSIHTKYPDNFIIPDPYGIKESNESKLPKHRAATTSATAPAANVAVPSSSATQAAVGGDPQAYASMSVTKQKAIKEYLLSKLEIVIPEEERAQALASYSTKNTCDELQDAFNHYKAKRAIARSIQDSRQMVNMTMSVLETGMISQKVVDLSLMEGCSQNTALMVDGGEFDDILVELTGGTFANYHPLTRLSLSIGFGLFAYYGAQKMTRQVTQKQPFQHPMAQFMNHPPSTGAAGANVGMPPSGAYPMPWPYMPNAAAPAGPPQFSTAPQQPMSTPQHYHHNTESNIEMQQRIQAQEAARQQQSRVSMLHADTTMKRKRNSPPLSESHVAPAVELPSTHSTLMDHAAQRYTADQIEDYHKSKKLKKQQVSDQEDNDSGDHEDEDSNDGTGSISDGSVSGRSSSETSSREATPLLSPEQTKTRTAAILTSSTLQAKIDKAIAMNKKENLVASTTVAGGFVPLKKQTVEGPPSPVHPRGGANLAMAPPVQPVITLTFHMATTVKEALHPDFAGLAIMLFISQVGGKLIVDEVHQHCGEGLDNPLVKMLVIYSVLYLGTRDKMAALVWTFLITALWNVFIHGPGQKYCSRPRDGKHSFEF